jgi:hypothetical protein
VEQAIGDGEVGVFGPRAAVAGQLHVSNSGQKLDQ